MLNPEIDAGNIIAVTEEDLKEDQKQAMERAIEEYRQLCLKSFSLNKSGQVIQKQDLPLPRQVTFDSNPGKLQEMVNSAVNHALINHSNVLSNTVHNAVIRTFKEGQASPRYVGPAYHQPESASAIAPSAPPAVVSTEISSPPVSAGLSNVQSTPISSFNYVLVNSTIKYWTILMQNSCIQNFFNQITFSFQKIVDTVFKNTRVLATHFYVPLL
jgi:hypothetical protein